MTLRIRRRWSPIVTCAAAAVLPSVLATGIDYYSPDGIANNLVHPRWGSAAQPRIRSHPPLNGYVDNTSQPRTEADGLPSAHAVHLELFRNAVKSHPNKGTSQLLLYFGQFVAHDITRSAEDGNDEMPIPCSGGGGATTHVPHDHPHIPEPVGVGTCSFACPGGGGGADATMPFFRMQRSATVAIVDPDPDGQISQQQDAAAGEEEEEEEEEKAGGGGSSAPSTTINFATSYLDLDLVYGSVIGGPPESDLRTYVGGRMKLDPQTGLPPLDTESHGQFVTADPQSRIGPSLLALHTVFLRYHNMRADFHAERHKEKQGETEEAFYLTDEELYWLARMDTTYAYQNIVEEKYVPTVLGTPLPPYKGYDPTVDPSIDVFFSTCAFRYGHSGLSGAVRVLDPTFRPLPADPLLLRDVFDQTESILEDGAPDGTTTAAAILRGMSAEPAKAADGTFVDDVAYFTKQMAVANVQRGRDAGLPSYNDAREAFGLPRMESMNDLADGDERVAEALQGLYRSVDDVDAYVGGLLEPHHVSSSSLSGRSAFIMGLGPLMTASMQEQFARLRDGDRFWYKARLTEEEIGALPSLSAMVKMTFGEEEMRYFPVDSFAAVDQLAVGMGEGGKGKQGMPLADGASLVLLEEVAFTASWAFSRSQDKTRRYIDMTLSIGDLVRGGYISIGWGSQTMSGSEIWHCTAATVDDAAPSPSCAIPSPGAVDDVQGSSPTSATADPLLFSCCVAPGLTHVAPRCAGEAYPLDVVDSCLSPEASFVTFRVPLCKRREEEEEEVGTENKKCYRLPQGEVDFIAAFNPSSTDGPHGFSRRTAGQLDLNSGWGAATGNDSANGGLFALHGGTMIICWFVLVPAAIYIVRYCKGKPWRLVAHITLVGITGSLVFAVATAAIVSAEGTSFGTVGGGSVFSEHKIVGLCVVAFVLFMLITGEARRTREINKVLKTRWIDRAVLIAHRCGGFTLLGLSWWNCYTGLERMSAYESDSVEMTWLSTHTTTYDMQFFSIFRRYMLFPLITAICLIFLATEIRMRRSRGTEHIKRVEAVRRGSISIWGSETGGQGLQDMSIDTFLELTRQGSPFCIVDGFVIDLTFFMDVHPGGSRILRFAIGSDISEHLIGQRDVDGIYHVHSPTALRTLRTLVKARLDVPEKDTSLGQWLTNVQGSSRESVKKEHHRRRPRLSRRGVNLLVFRDATIVDMEYVTLEKNIETKPVVRVRLALKKESADVLKGTPLPSTTFVFRGRDSFGGTLERPYTPVKCYSSNAKEDLATDPMGLPTAFSTSFRSAATKKELIYYEFLINLLPQGKMSSFLKNKKPGSHIMVQGPLANETVLQKVDEDHQTFREIVLIAAGTGIAPMLQLIDYYCADLHSPGLTEPPKSVSGNDKPKVFLAWIIHSKSLSFEGAAQLKERMERFQGNFRYFVICHEIESSSRKLSSRKLGLGDADASKKPVLLDALSKTFSAKVNRRGSLIWMGSESAVQCSTSLDDRSFQNEGSSAKDTDDEENAPEDSSDSATVRCEFLDRYRTKGHLDKELIARLLPLATGRDFGLLLNPSNDEEEYDDETRARIGATYPNTLVAVCGRPAFDDQCVDALLELGFGEEQVITFNRGNVPVSTIALLNEKIAARTTQAPGPNSQIVSL